MLISNFSRSLKMCTTMTHYIDNIIGLSIHGRIDFAKHRDNTVFGFSISFGA